MSLEYCITFRKEKCIQCHGCETACKVWRGVETGVKFRMVINTWHGSYPGIKRDSAAIACLHCVEPACISACPAGAIEKHKADGIVIVDKRVCTGCRSCFEACPYHVPQFGNDGKMQKCDMCTGETEIVSGNPPCVATCPTGALLLMKMDKETKACEERKMLSCIGIADYNASLK